MQAKPKGNEQHGVFTMMQCALRINEISSTYSSSYRPQHHYIQNGNNILLTYPSRLILSGMLGLADVEQEVDLDYSMRQNG